MYAYERALQMLANDAANLTHVLSMFDSTETLRSLSELENSNDFRMDEISRLTRDVVGVMERIAPYLPDDLR